MKWKRKARREWVGSKEIKKKRESIFSYGFDISDMRLSLMTIFLPYSMVIHFIFPLRPPFASYIRNCLGRRAEKNNQLAPILHSHSVDSLYIRRSYCIQLSQCRSYTSKSSSVFHQIRTEQNVNVRDWEQKSKRNRIRKS